MEFTVAALFQQLQGVPEQQLGAVSAGSACARCPKCQTLSGPLLLPGAA